MSTRGKPFTKGASGNPSGRPKGSRDRATIAADVLLQGEAEAITRKAIELALSGDTVALRMCLDRIAPPRRDRPVRFALPEMKTPADLTKATGALLAAVAEGVLTPMEAAELGKLVSAHVSAIQTTDLQARLDRIEAIGS